MLLIYGAFHLSRFALLPRSHLSGRLRVEAVLLFGPISVTNTPFPSTPLEYAWLSSALPFVLPRTEVLYNKFLYYYEARASRRDQRGAFCNR